MNKEMLLILLLGHILGDFYFQNEKIAKEKEDSLKWVWIHGILYGCAMIFVSLPVISISMSKCVFIAIGAHFIIDISKYYVISALDKIKVKRNITLTCNANIRRKRNIFFCDQALHILSILVITCFFSITGFQMKEISLIKIICETIGIMEVEFTKWLLVVLILYKPTNIAIHKLIAPYEPQNKLKSRNAGRFIGTIERLIILSFIYLNQYAAIGFVLTAKSIARFEQIVKEEDFAEYYLLGTLLSVLFVIIVSVIL